ncbi:hypothetical protein [Rhabdothermincola salaria]|uniref:hypothetical protein n=1 Tax=Rhabdothermincola salaria TaxID=2903142 RepID=UPI001E341E76|nr:hypothetical protein [Rhabdothermincola salaria]MCD9622498.1 hypothetical protein [Rhabdothermincola salaria]
MSFGARSGPPASAKQLAYLESLVEQAGFASFREARHPLGLTQRQAGGKFSKQEASALIDQLLNADAPTDDTDAGPPDLAHPTLSPAAERRAQAAAERLDAERALTLRGMPAELLAAELERRGWEATAPPG